MRDGCVLFVRVNDAQEWRERYSLPKLNFQLCMFVYVYVCVCLCMFAIY